MTGTTSCALRVAGPLAQSVGDAMQARFAVVWRRSADSTVLTVDDVDQAAVRAVMDMLWDSGHEVLSVTTISGFDVQSEAESRQVRSARDPGQR